ncbi:nicotinate-nucleotide adenylyltransferase [Aneurinibacillus migulanus]|uniref:Probable nicotinate-nucleotide adenylyltransferase n=1 Tax=Aneurinibacillus migulanus TaxID=47500 RepID=A0A0D1XLQ9_ANEMI|nr:nicotinate-nucleotide adenylyltransferase [Aneurinibacillus migulanus]KIV55151.1 nicotinate-nucleotide adenylyltransferase [Aneurinibacillus migulanus]KIV56595.1 nicotinate-nucleotide adenylyltransferase [Aneurinibacillus migulanus]KON95355.1 nicotinate-nucleotide adenylyltransferase [Aneurinibacillus migulanus]KPD06074.1 nicotinate-nucleotide adenylyltransferase [Aneurinibacillus migulanus]MED0893693.1 nicotinate-nucleotide adenylyltransferase [Aneurinibacillus migulanus]
MSFRNSRKKVGLYGGTFDPIHTIHLIVAEQARDALEIDEIWFLPARIPPHKQTKQITADIHRVEMIARAIAGHSDFRLDTIELEREPELPSYTYDTVHILKERHPDIDFYFIIGGDMAAYLPKWHRIDELILMVQFVALARPGYVMDNPYMRHVIETEMPQLDVSSSMIRKKIAQGRSIRYLVPEAVRMYIEEKRLYEA